MSGSYSNGYQYSSYYGTESTGSAGQGEFSRLSQVIGTNIQKISQNVASMEKMVSQLGTQQDSESLRSQVHQIQHYTNQLAKDTNHHLKELANLPLQSSVSEQRQRKMLKERLTNEFSVALKNFQTCQRTAAQKEKESVMRARAYSGLSGNPFGDEATPADNLINLQSPTQVQMLTSMQMEEVEDIGLLREREQAIRQLEADIVDVNHIFKDLATMVHEQGEVIDSIEANVESTTVHVTEGVQQLAKARDSQSKARRKKFILLVILLVVLGILIGLIAVYTS